MLSFQFINFYHSSFEEALKSPVFPIASPFANIGNFVCLIKNDGHSREYIDILDIYDRTVLTSEILDEGEIYNQFEMNEILNGAGYNNIGDRFIMRCGFDGQYWYSQILQVVPADGFSNIKYSNNENAFDFPFRDIKYVSANIPILLFSPQFVQDDKTYVKDNGEVVTLYAKYYKEWQGETEYLSEAMHEKIITALSCDEVYINGKRVTKTDKYQIDWENYTYDCDGVTKLAKATFKVRENITQRNSNY